MAVLLGGGDDHVKWNVPPTRCGRGATGQPRASRSVASVQLLPAATLLARIDRAWTKSEALAYRCRTDDGAVDGDHQLAARVHPGSHHLPAHERAGGERRGQISRAAGEALARIDSASSLMAFSLKI